jgi:hypothetical protein
LIDGDEGRLRRHLEADEETGKETLQALIRLTFLPVEFLPVDLPSCSSRNRPDEERAGR